MKAFMVVLLFLLNANVPRAQTVPADSAPPDVTVVKFEWYKNARRPGWDAPMLSAADPIGTTPQLGSSGRRSARRGEVMLPYVYSVKIKNTGAKTISAIGWEHVFTDLSNGKELSRHPFRRPIDISPKKEKTVIGSSSKPPTSVISVGALEKNPSRPFNEQVVINCVAYADGSVWKRASFVGSCKPGAQRQK